jgi:polyisoprenoid-binding protein YceI
LKGLVVLILVACAGLVVAQQANQEFRIDAASTSVVVHVGRAGLFAFAGHDHEVTAPVVDGSVSMNLADLSRSRVTLQFDARAIKVTGRGEPAADVAEVQRTMLGERVLDTDHYPTITFESSRISMQRRSDDDVRLLVDGRLTLHGMSQALAVPVAVRNAGGRMTATGTATVRQSTFGIRPVTAAGGTVRVKDDLSVTFTVVATAR